MKKKKVILILGKQVLADGTIPHELKLQVQKASLLMDLGQGNLLVITGGVTRPGFPSEAEIACEEVPEHLRSFVLLEPTALSTRQNIERVRSLLCDYDIESIIVVTSSGHVQRTNYLFKRYWPEVLTVLDFDNIDIKESLIQKMIHKVIYIMTVMDPNEKFFLPLKRRCLDK